MKNKIELIQKNWAIIVFLAGLIGQWYIQQDKIKTFEKHIDESNRLIQELREFKGSSNKAQEEIEKRLNRIERRLERRGVQ